MKNQKFDKNYYLGLDIGTNSVGYAVTNKSYDLLKINGKTAWGSHLFEEGKTSADRRNYRNSRRRLERKKQRIGLLQEIFANEISKVDEKFYVRLKESALWSEDSQFRNTIFDDIDYKDKDFHKQYPTIHHLIMELIENEEPHDVRLVYLACAWLIAHRGHFLNNISEDSIEQITDFDPVYEDFESFFAQNEYMLPWQSGKKAQIALILKEKASLSKKYSLFKELVFDGKAPQKEISEYFPYNQEAFVKLLCGSKVDVAKLFNKEEYKDIENKSISLGMEEEKFASLSVEIGEDYSLIDVMRKMYDWSVLDDILNGNSFISKSKIDVYNQHQKDLKLLKYFIKKYLSDKYDEVFRVIDSGTNNYVKYSGHYDNNVAKSLKLDKYSISNQEDFCLYIKKILADVKVEDEDKFQLAEINSKIELGTFMPKQRTTDNRVVPKQLYKVELIKIVNNAQKYLSFLNMSDENGYSNAYKILSIFDYKIPYFVGPLNENSSHAWVVRKGKEKILPWNMQSNIDMDASEQNFIKRMTGHCTYIPGEDVLPKDSIVYQKFIVLNAINNLRINNNKISIEQKQTLFSDLFLKEKRITGKKIKSYFVKNGLVDSDKIDSITGIDDDAVFSLATYHYFRRLIENNILNESQVEDIVNRAAYSEDKNRLKKYINVNYPQLQDVDVKYIIKGKFKDFGRLSKRFLNGLEGCDADGELMTIMSALWNRNENLMELLSDRFSFAGEIEKTVSSYYENNKSDLNSRLNEMYIPNPVKRQIYRTFDVVNDIKSLFGVPQKIFIEMTRGGEVEKKRTITRKNQLLKLFQEAKDIDVREMQARLEDLGERADNLLQGDKLFLYYCQMGKCMYSGTPIDVEKLLANDGTYNIEHIYPQAYVKDDSILNNKILVTSKLNGQKSDTYPINIEIQEKMKGFWYKLYKNGLITEEKYKRLTRITPFSDGEKLDFINRQIVETSQATKAMATLLKEKFPETEIVYVKAGLVSQYRQEYSLIKSRQYNDLHHAKDAYLNIVVGNVYNEKFTKKWFSVHDKYSLNLHALFEKPLLHGNEIVWNGVESVNKVNEIMNKNSANCTIYAFCRHGGLFDQMLLKAREGLIPRKKGLDVTKYGGYDGRITSYFLLAKYKVGKKYEVVFVPIELQMGENVSLEQIENQVKKINPKATEISFPIGFRKIKINSIILVDGFPLAISGGSLKDSRLLMTPMLQFASDLKYEHYLKKCENLVRKMQENKNYVFDEKFDKITNNENVELYDLYLDKLKSLYSKRPAMPMEVLKAKRELFCSLSIQDQARCLVNIHSLFTRAYLVDLKLLNESSTSAKSRQSIKLNNWKYQNIILLDSSVSGLKEKRSINLKALL